MTERQLSRDKMGFNVKNMSFEDVGCGSVTGESINDPPVEAAGFTAQEIILQHPVQITASSALVQDCHIARVASKFAALKKVDYYSGKKLESGSKFCKAGDAGMVHMVPRKFMHFESFSDKSSLGFCCLRHETDSCLERHQAVDAKTAGAGRSLSQP